ncbi:MAG: phospholipid-binding protein [Rhizobiaceae bacterium]
MRKIIAVFAALAVVGLASPAFAMSMSFKWGPTKNCNDSKSPPITVKNVPDGTRKLKFKMVDLNKPTFNHGGGTVTWKGNGDLPYGAFRYKGPCPPSPHTYEISVIALGSGNKVLATAKSRQRFP